MLTEEAAVELGCKKPFLQTIHNPSLVREGTLWNKCKCPLPLPQNYSLGKKYPYSKLGRTFRLPTKRYLQYCNSVLLYYDVFCHL